MKTLSLRNRLLFGIWALLLLTVAPPVVYLTLFLRADFMEEAQHEAFQDLSIATWLLGRHGSFSGPEELDRLLKDYEARTGRRLSYIASGKVIADSSVPYPELANLDDHAARPEIKAAVESGRGLHRRLSASLDREMIYVAESASGIDGIPAGILRLAVPVSEVQAHFNKTASAFLWVLAGTFLLAGLVARFASRPLLETLGSMAGAARELGAGNYERRIRHVPWVELQPLGEAVNTMADNICSRNAELEARRAQLEALFNALHQGVVVLDAQGRIESLNRAAEPLFGSGRYMGQTLLEASMNPELQHAVDMVRRGERRQIRIILEFGPGKAYEVTAAAMQAQEGRMLAVFRDIGEERRLERMRRDFTANVSHELKTPLTSIKGYAEMLLDTEPNEERRREYLETILRNAEHMSRMVSGLLTLARAEHDADGAEPAAAVDIGPIAAEAVTAFRPRAEAKNIELTLDPDVAGMVPGGRDALTEVLSNLLDNALKYTPAGGRVRVRAERRPGRLVVRVEDNGPAVPEADRERIFERFFRSSVPGAPEAKTGGAGLGLAICRRIVKSLGGDIWLESPLDTATDTGAAFCFSLEER